MGAKGKRYWRLPRSIARLHPSAGDLVEAARNDDRERQESPDVHHSSGHGRRGHRHRQHRTGAGLWSQVTAPLQAHRLRLPNCRAASLRISSSTSSGSCRGNRSRTGTNGSITVEPNKSSNNANAPFASLGTGTRSDSSAEPPSPSLFPTRSGSTRRPRLRPHGLLSKFRPPLSQRR